MSFLFDTYLDSMKKSETDNEEKDGKGKKGTYCSYVVTNRTLATDVLETWSGRYTPCLRDIV